jgi:hypothetical protein
MINHKDTKDTKTEDESVALKQSGNRAALAPSISLFFLVPFVFVVTIL